MSGVDFDREIAQIYRDMELYLIESMQRNLARHLACLLYTSPSPRD